MLTQAFYRLASTNMPPSLANPEKAYHPHGEPIAAEAAIEQPANIYDDAERLQKSETKASEMFDAIPMWRKCIVVFVTGWTALAACFSSTSLLSASTEIAADLHTTKETINLSTAGILLAIGLSPLVWSPIAAVCGRVWHDGFRDEDYG